MSGSSHTLPPIDVIEQPFQGPDLSEAASGASAWAATKDAVAAEGATKHPAIDSAYAASRILEKWEAIKAQRAGVLTRLSQDEAVEVAKAMDSLPRLALALLYANAQVALEPNKDIRFNELVEDALGLRRRSFESGDILERLGHIPAGTIKQIRKGQGHADLANDLQALSNVLTPHQPKLASLQALAVPGTETLTATDLARLSHVGSVLSLRLTQPGAAGPWYTALVGLISLTARSYDRVISMLHYHLKCSGHAKQIREFPMFFGLRRPASSKGDDTSTPPSV
jgi:hypothetical protein